MKNLFKVSIQALFLFAGLFSHNASDCSGRELTQYVIQVLASADNNTAHVLLNALTKKGYKAYIHEAAEKNGALSYKVRIGRFETIQEAKQHAGSLQKEGIAFWITTAEQEMPEGAERDAAPPEPPEKATELADSPAQSIQKTQAAEALEKEKSILEKSSLLGTLKKNYKYYNPEDSALHVTSSYTKIPGPLRSKIKEIAMFPVKFVALDIQDLVFSIDADGEKKKVKLDALKKAAKHAPDAAVKSLEDFLGNAPLRIKYEPSRIDADAVIHGSLYLQNGSPVEIELLRRGIATYNPDALPALQKEAFMGAEKQAREEKAGIWGE